MLKKNVIANFAGGVWSAIIGLIFVPIYVRLMGVESYGLVGFFTSLQIVFAILDLGLSQTISREMARLKATDSNSPDLANTARTFELIYWATAVLILIITISMSSTIANYWLKPEKLTRESVQSALTVMAFALGLRWPSAIYIGGLVGLQKQVAANWIGAIMATVQSVGAVLVLYLAKPTVENFFAWQAVMTLAQVLILRQLFWQEMPKQIKPQFSKEIIKKTWRFAASMSSITLLSLILTQLDKIILSKVLSLTAFGYYSFASTVALTLYKLISPIFTAYYPRLTELVSQNKTQELIKTYHQGCRLLAVMTIPAAFSFIFFAESIILIWTRNADLTNGSYQLVIFLIAGNLLNGFMNIPYALQLAHGWTRLAIYTNVIAVVFLGPSIYYVSTRWGALPATYVWVLLNFGYILINIPIMHRKILPEEKWVWYKNDLILPFIISLTIFVPFKLLTLNYEGMIIQILAITAAILGSTLTLLKVTKLK